MINVYLNTKDKDDWIRLSPTGSNIVKNCKFFFNINDLENNQIDFFVVFNQINDEVLLDKINKKNSILIACEPPSVHIYNEKYINQFEYLVCPNPKVNHPKKINITPFFPWHVGHNRDRALANKDINYNYLFNKKYIKNKKISVIQSNKILCNEHIVRKKIIDGIINEFGSKIDIFGEGFKGQVISDKVNVLSNYHYNICIENFFGKDFWTEKLSDPLITRTNPIYLGCKNLNKYFPENFITLKENNMDHNLSVIEKILKKNDHEFYYEKSRELIFKKYNLLTFLSDFIEKNLSKKVHKVKYKKEIPIIEFQNIKSRIFKFLSLVKMK